MAGASLSLTFGCAGELDGDPSEYIGAYGKQASAGSGPAGTGGAPSGGAPNAGAPNAGAPSGGKGGGTIPPDPTCVAEAFKDNGCTGCHSTSLKLGGFDLTGSDLGKRFSTLPAVYQVSSAEAGMCDKGALIIQPDNPSRSVLLRKIKKMESCGDPMPQAGSLPADDLACIEKWVNSFGASANKITLDEEGSGTGGNTF